ncbi:MAG: COX15/CtaA family protein [Gammaproteobacteria bacterium]|uniref:COX15/CtaA family protein n=1 Tax=Candidatus Thiopontia autotrophica TaxID=2841688 RepID=A0A8J6P4M9_9GAMM|nr:COX15/CtaA family protein [Candidatus Thiopontia autotrophica]MBL6969165.1 COX15/CtaA family protein [Gammaproteobacteria bacterium]
MRLNIRYLVVITVLLVVTLNFTSSYIRHVKSGLECVERPLCYGEVGVTGEAKGFAGIAEGEYHLATMTHRTLAGVIAILVLLVNIVLIRAGESDARLRKYAVTMGGTVLWLAGLGITAGGSLGLWVVMGNLLGGMILLGSSALLMAGVFGWEQRFSLQRVVMLAGAMLLLTMFMQGGMVSAKFAGMACTTLPDCNGYWWAENPLIQMHMMHRFSAAVAILYFGVMLLRALRRGDSGQRNFLLILLLLLFVQIKLGGLMVEEQLPLIVTSVHSTLSQLLIAALLIYSSVTGVRTEKGIESGV